MQSRLNNNNKHIIGCIRVRIAALSYKGTTETYGSNTTVDILYFPKHCRCQARRVVLVSSGAFIPATFGEQGGYRSTFNQ